MLNFNLTQDTDTFNRTNNSISEWYSESIVEFDLEKDNDDLNNNTNETFENESLNDESSISNITYSQSVVNKESNQSSIPVPDFLKRKSTEWPDINEKQVKRIEWISQIPLHEFKVSNDGKMLLSVKQIPSSYMTSKMLSHYCKKILGLSLGNGNRMLEQVKTFIVKHIMNTTSINKFVVSKRTTKNPKTKPQCLLNDGTLYRVINVITSEEGRGMFIKTRKQHTCVDLDISQPNSSLWGGMTNIYSTNDDMASISDPKGSLTGYNISCTIACSNNVDKFSTIDFNNITLYILAYYK